jgi:CheY-like chemotaxis protein
MKKYILVVDDQPRWIARTCEELSVFGFELLTATGLHSAEALLEKHENEIALVVCDNSMPIGGHPFPNSGLDVLEGMRLASEAQATIPFILFTSEVNETQRARVAKHSGHIVLKQENMEGELALHTRELLAS